MPSGNGGGSELPDRLIAEGNAAERGGRLHEACDRYRAAVEAAPEYAAAHLNLGIGLEALGDQDGAMRSYEAALARDPGNPYVLYNLGKLAYARGSPGRAETLVLQALKARPQFPEASVVAAGIREALGDPAAAAVHLESALRQRPDYAGAAYNYGLVLGKLGRSAEAESALRRALELDPVSVDAARALGEVLSERGAASEAEACYRSALALQPGRGDVTNLLGHALAAQGKLAEAEALYRSLLASDPRSIDALCNLGTVLHLRKSMAAAAACYREAIALAPDAHEAHFNLGNVLKDQGRAKESIASYRKAISLRPDYAPARWALAMAQIPLVYQDETEPHHCRDAFAEALADLEHWFAGARTAQGHVAVGAQQPFYLAYQEEDNSALLRRYGELCAGLMAAWLDTQELAPRSSSRAKGAPLRVGVVSQYFHDHPVWNAIVKGWFRGLDPQRFALHGFYLGAVHDDETAFAASRAARFHGGARGLRHWIEAIREDDVDVLVYPEIGMDATALKLASLRLAPVQVASWGHPETTGLPTIDYFLSAERLEPRDAQAHYTERLVCLPNVGCSYEPRRIAPAPFDTARLGLEAGVPLLVCAGTPFKYAPRYDRVLVRIARRLERCRLVFFTHYVPEISAELRDRLQRAFARDGLELDRFAVFMPWQPPPEFYGVLTRADVLLDTIGFSGFNTAMQALECGLPIVTQEGRFLRGRLASGVLRHIGLDDLVAETEDRYVELAVRICRDESYRRGIRERIALGRAALYEDGAVTAAMERFLESAVRSSIRSA
jgi:predicted O-linked N-acetylglucosamine transferase (SPINDLY family)